MEKVYIIRARSDGLNLGFVTTRDEAERICAELPALFIWEPLMTITAREENF